MSIMMLLALVIAVCLLGLLWIKELGLGRALLAATARLGWLLPLFSTFFPHTISSDHLGSLKQNTLWILLDDSLSMKDYASKARQAIDDLKSRCLVKGCDVKIFRLSDYSDKVAHGYTPLMEGIEAFSRDFKSSDAWVILSDGGDYQPGSGWEEKFRNLGLHDTLAYSFGAVVAFGDENATNIWLDDLQMPKFAFSTKKSDVTLVVKRQGNLDTKVETQVQILKQGKPLAVQTVHFAPGQTQVPLALELPALSVGKHSLNIKVLATPGEYLAWDNEIFAPLEVMSNTVGVLHLLGSPSWDGRFLRRFLKAEPKFDLVSFYILRDPWDSPFVNERELSLIQFPVNKLFGEELANFKVVVLQNFNLLQFLQEEFQRNLVRFVEDGGGLLFVGGDRALLENDIVHSPLKSILPFTFATNGKNFIAQDMAREDEKIGPWYDKDQEFQLELARPTKQQRALAAVFDDFEVLAPSLASLGPLKGIHRSEEMVFKKQDFTPLLEARIGPNKTLPLVLASYPGKGRAIWVLTDALWQVAMSQKTQVPRELYHKLLFSSLTWLMREEFTKQMIATDLQLHRLKDASLSWRVKLEGPIVPYFSLDADWEISLCGNILKPKQVSVLRLGNQALELSGESENAQLEDGECQLVVRGQNKAFGSAKAEALARLTPMFKDSVLRQDHPTLAKLAKVTHAKFLYSDKQAELIPWLDGHFAVDEDTLVHMQENRPDYYWFLRSWWVWLVLICMPLEVVVRRWHLLIGRL